MIAARRWRDRRDDLLLAAILYTVCCSLVLLFWPGQFIDKGNVVSGKTQYKIVEIIPPG